MEDFRLDELEELEIEEYEEQRRRERMRRRAQMRRIKERQRKIRHIIKIAIPCVAVLVLLLIGKHMLTTSEPKQIPDKERKIYQPGQGDIEAQKQEVLSGDVQNTTLTSDGALALQASESPDADMSLQEGQQSQESQNPQTMQGAYVATATESTASIEGEVVSSYAILVDTKTGNIVAQRSPKTKINPASMTKVLTVLVAAEHVTNLEDKFTITQEITDYSFKNDCSNVGFEVGEEVTIEDLFYGTILPSGADAAVGLAEYVAGSQEAFVELMNKKLEELGLSSTAHFTNCVGLYDEQHYCSVYDMAMILQAALDNELCRKVLSAHTYNTSATEQHPEGLLISNWFLRRIEDKDAGGFVLAGKTGYVVESGSCAASCALDGEENEYICVTANSTSSWRCIYDHVDIYKTFLPQGEEDAVSPQSE